MPARVPVLDAMAYPMHVLWVPIKTFGANIALGTVLLVAARDLLEGFGLILVGAAWVAWHAYIAWRFRQDPHIEGVWVQRLFRARRWAWERTRNQVAFVGNKYGP
jgi:hypothetical protein